MNLLVLILAVAGFSMLCLGMPRHLRQVVNQAASPGVRRALRGLGWALLASSLWPAVHVYGWSIGITIWLGVLSMAALGVAWLLAYRPALLAWLGGAAMVAVLRRLLNDEG